MYVSYLLEKEASMYPGSLRCNNHSLPAQNFASTTPYSDYMGYHQVQSMDNHGQPAGTWGPPYSTQREEWNAYGPGPSGTAATTTHLSGSSPGQISYTSGNYSSLNPAGSGSLPPVDTINTEQLSPLSPRHSSYEWMRKTVQSTSTGMLNEGSLRLKKPLASFFCQHFLPSSPPPQPHPTRKRKEQKHLCHKERVPTPLFIDPEG